MSKKGVKGPRGQEWAEVRSPESGVRSPVRSAPGPLGPSAPRPRSARRSAGFTLVEALAAGIILSASAALIGLGVSQSMASLQRARNYQHAAELLHEVLTKIDIIGPERISREGPTDGSFEGRFNDRFRWEATIETSDRLEADLYDIQVRIIWLVPGGERSVEAHTIIHDPLFSRPTMLEWDEL